MKKFLLLTLVIIIYSTRIFSQCSATITSIVNASCNGNCDGSATVNVTGTPPFTYLWINGPVIPENYGLCAGTYVVTITDNTGCTATASATIAQPAALTIDVISATNVTCNGGSDGIITLSASGGVPAYTILWSNGANSFTNSNLPAGIYGVTITDSQNCSASTSVVITEPPVMTSTFTVSPNVICQGDNVAVTYTGNAVPGTIYNWNFSGATILSGSGGGPYMITWPAPGNYVISLEIYYNGCYSSVTNMQVTVDGLNLNYTQTDPSCIGNDGAIDITVSGGQTPYMYQWSNLVSSEDVSGLYSGNYMITVTDVNGCTIAQTMTLFQTSQLGQLTGLNTYSGGYLPSNDYEIYLFKLSGSGGSQMDTVGYLPTISGPWAFVDLLPDTYYVKANLLNPLSYPNLLNSYYDSTFSWQYATPIAINCDDSIDIVFQMYEMLILPGGSGTISGTIVMSSNKSVNTIGEPVPGAEVLIEQEPNDIPVQGTVTDNSGNYLLNNIPFGTGYFLVVDIPGIPQLSTFSNITITGNDSFTNLNFIVDTTSGGGIITDPLSSVIEDKSDEYMVNVFPNPFISSFEINLSLKKKENVSIEIFDESGKKINYKLYPNLSHGNHKLVFDDLGNGIYYVLVRINNDVLIKKIISY